MKKALMDYLICPVCESWDLELRATEEKDGELRNGNIICKKCSKSFPISDFVPDFLPENMSKTEEKVREGFGFKWQLHPDILHTYEKRFMDEIYPVNPDFIKGKTVLNACCGIGIIDFFCAEMGAKEVIGFDISDSVNIARENCLEYNNTHFFKADMFNVPLRPEFDYVMCLAAVHHLKDPAKGFKLLADLVKNSGYMSIWVYAHEGNGLVRMIVEPLRRLVGTKFPLKAVNALSIFLGTILWMVIKSVYHPCKQFSVLRRLGKLLPMREYLYYIDAWPLKQVWEMVFDQLLAPITHYHRKEEIEQWCRDNDLELISLTQLNGNSWRCFAQKCAG